MASMIAYVEILNPVEPTKSNIILLLLAIHLSTISPWQQQLLLFALLGTNFRPGKFNPVSECYA